MRRKIPEEPVSQAAIWSRRLAVFALPVAAIAVVLARFQIVEARAAIAVLGGAIAVALGAVLLFAAACAVIWRTGCRGLKEALGGLALASVTLGYPAYLAFQAVRLPVLADISTDTVDPPHFSLSAAAMKARAFNTAAGPTEKRREKQRNAYPDVEPIVVDLEPDEAFQLVLKTAAGRGWRLVDQRAASRRSGMAHADFVARTPVMGFAEDVTVRLRPLAGQTRIDLRSASRFGRHDFGGNARRIEQFAEDLQEALNER
jgi:uncharacterized protein (DUF1499 family)